MCSKHYPYTCSMTGLPHSTKNRIIRKAHKDESILVYFIEFSDTL